MLCSCRIAQLSETLCTLPVFAVPVRVLRAYYIIIIMVQRTSTWLGLGLAVAVLGRGYGGLSTPLAPSFASREN